MAYRRQRKKAKEEALSVPNSLENGGEAGTLLLGGPLFFIYYSSFST